MPETTEIMRNRPLNHMKDNIHEDGLKVVLRTADAYADQINMEKNNSMTGYDTVIYGNF
jgi:hypothetical protein